MIVGVPPPLWLLFLCRMLSAQQLACFGTARSGTAFLVPTLLLFKQLQIYVQAPLLVHVRACFDCRLQLSTGCPCSLFCVLTVSDYTNGRFDHHLSIFMFCVTLFAHHFHRCPVVVAVQSSMLTAAHCSVAALLDAVGVFKVSAAHQLEVELL